MKDLVGSGQASCCRVRRVRRLERCFLGQCRREEEPRRILHFDDYLFIEEGGLGSCFSTEVEILQAGPAGGFLTLRAELLSLSRAMAEAKWLRSMWMESNHRGYTLEHNDE